jgi:DNA-binding transcriptional ArsR family regulator
MANEPYSTNLVFKALADPTRREILRTLSAGALPAGAVASHFPISGPSVSRHLAVLKSAGLVSEVRQANRLIYSLEAGHLLEAVGSWLNGVAQQADPGTKAGRMKKGGKSATKRKRKAAAKEQGLSAPRPELGAPAPPNRDSAPGHPGEKLPHRPV